ncbi:MAG TPA: VWA domain-containing protein [Vicinamibacterales bacterium]|nr:VWA domain-containing protein [Vicinamibacterales bacterium]
MHRVGVAFVASALASFVLVVSAQQAPPPAAPAQGQPAASQQPVFRAGADVIRLDVSVLDKNRRPVRGLTADDFNVVEDGTPQRVVAVSEVDAEEYDPAPTAWMRHVTPDVSANDLADQIGDGRVFAVVLDDVNIPWDDVDIIQNARGIGRDVIDSLGPSDIAAVVYPRDAGNTEDFTTDREKLLSAVDKFDPREPDLPSTFGPSMSTGGDFGHGSALLGHSTCSRSQLTVPMFETLVSRLATVPNRRKTVVFVSTGVPIDFMATRGCPGELRDRMIDVFGRAARANVNIYSVDPAGYDGYARYLQMPIRRGGRPAMATMPDRAAFDAAKVRHDFLETMADYTGATATVNSDDVQKGIDAIFTEESSYYLIGYQTSNGRPDGKFRKVTVKVNKPGLTVRTRSGYFAPKADTSATRDAKSAPTTNDLGLVGMMSAPSLPLRVTAEPVALAGRGAAADVAVVLTVRLPAPRGPLSETVTVVRTLYDADGRAGPPVLETTNLALLPTTGEDLRYDLFSRLTLTPGRYQLRLNATSRSIDKSGSVYADIEVPDFTRAPLSLSAIVLGTKTPPGDRKDPLASIMPIVPTTARDFAPGDQVDAFLRVFQGGAAPPVDVAMNVQVLDSSSTKIADATQSIPSSAFGETRAASFRFDLPLEKLKHGPQLVSVTATPAGGPPVRKDLVFRIR